LEDRRIYVFDEITSALDSRTSLKLMKFIEKYARNKLVIFITHSPQVVKNCDAVLSIGDPIQLS
jgi:ATP-binding cassette subfamily C protein